MNRRLLLVAYPLLPVSEASAGGAEQVLWTLERELAKRGWHTQVAACAGSHVSGELLATGEIPHALDSFEERAKEHTERVVEECARKNFDMILDHSGHFFRHAGRVEQMVLATLHLPRSLYPADAFRNIAANVHFNCVSDSQLREFPELPRRANVVRNGIAVERFRMGGKRANYLLWLGRVCPEKAPHLAIAAAMKAKMPIVVAGHIYPFASHKQYWEREVLPLIDGEQVRWVPLPPFEEKLQLLRQARALLVSSQIAETTSLVALEAMACGTPVIAFNAGALGEVVPKQAGFIVSGVDEMAVACKLLGEIRSQDCREWVEQHYSGEAMAESYETLMIDLHEQQRWAARRRDE